MAEIDNLIAEVNKKYKTDIIRKASDLKGIEFIPYTSPMMNYLTRGGVDIAIIRNVIELNYNLGITDADVNLFNTEVGIMQELGGSEDGE